jgi:hypothetical protein
LLLLPLLPLLPLLLVPLLLSLTLLLPPTVSLTLSLSPLTPFTDIPTAIVRLIKQLLLIAELCSSKITPAAPAAPARLIPATDRFRVHLMGYICRRARSKVVQASRCFDVVATNH